jgi:hypothetical protein
MKGILIIIVAFTFIANNTLAQEFKPDFRDRLSFGFKAGTNLSNVFDVQGESFTADSKFGIVSGVFAIIPVSKFLGIQTEVFISQKGFHGTGVFMGSSYKFTRTASYIDLPLLIAYKPIGLVTLLAGPQYSFLFEQKDEFDNGYLTILQEQDFRSETLRKNTICFLGGLDLNVNHIVLGARAGVDLLNNRVNGTSATPHYKNVWYQATLGFRFF